MKTAAIAVIFAMGAQSASAFDVGSAFENAAKPYGIDPLLLYSVALAESAYDGNRNGSIAPWPWTLRTPTTPIYAKSLEEAQRALQRIVDEHGVKTSLDVGMMQINLRWNGYRVNSPTDLLDMGINLETGAEILAEAILSAPGDIELGLGRYHNWEDEARSRSYGSRILTIYGELQSLRGAQ